MGSSNKTISYTIDIGADITKARQAAEQLQATFKKSFGEGSNKGMFNLFSGLEKALDTLERKGSQKITSIADAKALEKAKQDVADYFAAIEREGKKIGNLGGADFKKRLEGLGTQLADSAKAWKTFEDAQKSANKEAEKQSSDIQKKIDDNKKLIQSMRELKAVQDALGGRGGEVATAKRNATRLENDYNKSRGVFLTSGQTTKKAQRDYEDYIKQHNISFTESGSISTSTKSKAKMGYITDADLQVINQYLATVRKLDKEIQDKEKAPRFDQNKLDAYKANRDTIQAKLDTELKNKHLSLTPSGQIDRTSIDKNLVNSNDLATIRQYIGEVGKLNKLIAAEEKKPKFDQQVIDQKKAERDAEQAKFDNAIKKYNLSLTATGEIDNTSVQQNRQAIEDQISKAQELGQAWKNATKDQQEAQKKMAEAQAQATKARTEANTKEATFKANADQYKAYSDQLKQNREDINQSREALRKFNDEASSSRFDQLKEALREIFGNEFVTNMENSEEGLEKLKEKLDRIGDEKMDGARARLKEFLDAFKESEPAGNAVKGLGDKVNKTSQDVRQLTDRQRDVENFINRFKYFFSLTNSVMLFRRALKQAIQTTKELDEVMTQTAVVSKNTVGDMWAKLPQYSKEAAKLGASIKEVYAAQTLYVQQGLEMDQAMKLGIETLKMARVAGLDAATATNTMTAALRGFKMELNEISVQNINDVYSKLAQNTASNVQEISTAMSKVAALANSANMSFEGTAAYLAKIIESTREGAETAGTALKTVLARFTEVKKLYSEAELTGTDEEGEEIDVNKISKALRTAGIEMNSFFTGAKSMEEVLDELGEKWDSLTVVQQRYIATMAAGSRQQSRFLALMQDWGRTTELVNMANNAEGSGQEQFEKTLESLAVKITNLKNAWNTFIMGLANNSLIKATVDVLKNIIQGVNTLIDKFSGGRGLLKSIMSVVAAFAVFKLGKGLLNNFLGNIGSKMGIAGAQAGKEFGTKFNQEVNHALNGKPITPRINTSNLGQARQVLKEIKAELQSMPTGSFDIIASGLDPLVDKFTAGAISEDQFINGLQRLASMSGLTDADLKKLQVALDQLGVKFDVAGNKAQASGQKINAVSKAASTATMALSLISMALMTWADSCDDGTEEGEKMSKVLKAVGMGLMFLIPIIMLTKETIKTAAAESSAAISSIPIIGWIAAVIAALIALISYIKNLFSEPPPKTTLEQLEELNEKLEESKKSIKETLEQYQKLWDSLSDIYDKRKALDDLRIGTEEWDNAVKDLNQSIQDLIELYPELIQFLNISSAGVYDLDTSSQGFKDYVKQQQINEFYAKIALAAVEYDQDTIKGLTTLEELEASDFTWKVIRVGYTGTAGGNTKEFLKSDNQTYDLIDENGNLRSLTITPYTDHRFMRDDKFGKNWGYDEGNSATMPVSGAFPLFALLNDLDYASVNDYMFSGRSRERIGKILEDETLKNLAYAGVSYFTTSNNTNSDSYDWGDFLSVEASLSDHNNETFRSILPNDMEEYVKGFRRREDSTYSDYLASKYNTDFQRIYRLTGLDKLYEALASDENLINKINNGKITSSADFWDYVSKQLEEWQKKDLEGLTIEEDHKDDFWEAANKYFKTQIFSASLLDQLIYSINTQNVRSENVMSYVLPIMKSQLEEFLTTGNGSNFGMDYYNLFFKFLNKNFAKAFNQTYSDLKDLTDDDLRYAFNQRSEEGGKTYSQLYREATGKKPGDEITREEMIYFLSYAKTAGTMVTGDDSPFATTIQEFSELDLILQKLLKEIVASSSKFGKITMSTLNQLKGLGENFANKINGDILDLLGLEEKTLTDLLGEANKAFEKYNFIKIGTESEEKALGSYIQEKLANSNIPIEVALSLAENASNILTQVRDNPDTTEINEANQAAFGFIDTVVDVITNQIDEGLTEESRELAYDLISKMDISSQDSIRATVRKLGNLGVAVDGLADRIINAAHAYDNFDLEKLKEEIENATSANSLAKKSAEEGKITYNASEYKLLDSLVSQGGLRQGEWGKNWIQLDFDEWVYIGEETNDILSIISDNVEQFVKIKYDEVNSRLEQAKEYKSKIQNNQAYYVDESGNPFYKSWAYSMQNKSGTVIKYDLQGFLGHIANLTIEDIGSAVLPYSGNDAEKKEMNYMRSALEIFGISTEGMSNEEVLKNLQYIQKEISNIPEYTQYMNEVESQYKFLQVYGTPQEQLNRALGYGIESENPEEIQYIQQQNAVALYGRAKSGGYLYTAENITEQLKEQGITEDEAENIGYALGYYADQAAKKINRLTEALNKNWKAIKENDKKSQEYKDAMNALLPIMSEILGFKVDKKFINENDKYFDAIIEGGEGAAEAWKELFKIARQQKIANIDSTDLSDKVKEAVAILDKNDSFNIEVGSTVDLAPLIEGIELAQDEGQALANYISSLAGLSAVWVVGEDGVTGHLEVTGVGGGNTGKKTGGGGGGSNKEFKNEFDKYYNMVEDINELTRLRNLLETDYNQLLESEAASGKAIYDNLQKQIKLLRERRDITADLAEKRKQQILDEIAKSENADLSEYAWWNDEDLTIEIDWDKIDAVKDSELGDRIKEFVSTLEGFQSKYDEQIEALEDIESTLQEIEKRGRDQYTSLEDRVRDALIKRIQDQIDELTVSNEGINTANQNLLDSIQNTLDKQRQERDNAKTEEELSDKEQRLAYLQQDSSNANALEIANLQKELADERENYTDTLIDQKISELQEQNDKAAEQRQEQIDLLQQSLDWQEKNGEFWEQAYQLMNNSIGPDGTLVTGSELEQLLKQGEGWQALSQEGKMNWLSELETMVAEAVGYLYLSRQLEKIGTKAGTEITFTDAEGNTHTGKVDKNGNVVIDNGDGTQTVWKDVYQSYDGSYRTLETEEDALVENEATTNTQSVNNEETSESKPTKNWSIKKSGNQWIVEKTPNKGQYATQQEAKDEAYKKNKKEKIWGTKLVNGRYSPYIGGGFLTFSEANSIASDLNAGKNVITPYATGGLNTKTGPAWLDGTPSHPELVLNARDTENFLQLKDTLADLKKNGGLTNLSNGDNYYEISINVDEIGSDYDVDKLADRLRTLIYRDSQYRNVNTLNRLR